MTLLELLRQELPKRGGWPEGVNCIVQEDGGSVWGFVHEPEKDEADEWMEILRTGSHKLLGHLPEAGDRATAIVTREQYGWDGTDLPPVGVECEMQNDDGQWINVCIIAQFDGFSFGWNYDCRMVYFSDKPTGFRPLRTEAERAIDEMVRLSGVSIGAAKILYDVGYRKG
ncbi:hypothetical protein [Klebsiella phage BUCT_49532]|uniref:hypothetical protein n=1 Tax=Klebsiella phage BUCT_49532 TaxID=2849971 RepID=UPI001C788A3A|nr:hypothetical protein PQZ56_gp02 [Klebsiella phage BUCT_49532]WCI99705.1 hypothetical protein [Klebsiella phage BUCT_49532]